MRPIISPIILALVVAGCGTAAESTFDSSEAPLLSAASLASVLGFENSSDWNITAGTKSTTTAHSEGTNALALRNFGYVEVTSPALSTLSGVTNKLAFDLKLPTAIGWGQAQLFVDLPSRGLYNVPVGQVALAGSPAGTFRTVSFDLSPQIVDALKQTYADLRFKIVLNVPYGSADYVLDRLHFEGGTNTGSSLVELRVSDVNEYVVVSVNGIVRRTFFRGDPSEGQRLDVSSWFGGASSDVKIQSINLEGSAGHHVEMWLDGRSVLDDSCSVGACNGKEFKTGIVSQKEVSIPTANRPARQAVTLTNSKVGKVYVDDVFTGRTTPTTMSLPPGSYTLGIGVSNDVRGAYTGQYYEKKITVDGAPLNLDFTADAPLPLQQTTRIVILPIRQSINYVKSLGRADASNSGYLTDNDVELLKSQIKATSEAWMKPFSYGMVDWTVDVAAFDETVPMYETTPDGMDTGRFDVEAASILAPLHQQYDMVVYYVPQHRANGSQVADGMGIVWAFGGENIGMTSTFVRSQPLGSPNVFFLHEVSHNYESYNRNALHQYYGVSGLHGGHNHGYPFEGDTGETDFVKFYRHFLRGQVAEVPEMTNENEAWPSIPETSDIWVGVFPTMRRGFAAH